MKITIHDRVVDKLLKRRELVRARFHSSYIGAKPFRQEPVSPKEELLDYDELTPERKQWLVQNFREPAVDYINRMEKLKERYKQ